GSALSNDGSAKAGFTAPSVAGQARAISEALAVAGVDAECIGYLEAHGTGTPLGDLIELEALTRVFRRSSKKRAHCCLGSVKATFGHLDKAAGVIALIKACLAIKHGELPPTVNFRVPSPRLDWSLSPFYVRTDAGEWPADGRPRRAGVSSFGIGGTNAHVVLEQAPARDVSRSGRDVQLLTWSARTPGALRTMTSALAGGRGDEDPERGAGGGAGRRRPRAELCGHRLCRACRPSGVCPSPHPRRRHARGRRAGNASGGLGEDPRVCRDGGARARRVLHVSRRRRAVPGYGP